MRSFSARWRLRLAGGGRRPSLVQRPGCGNEALHLVGVSACWLSMWASRLHACAGESGGTGIGGGSRSAARVCVCVYGAASANAAQRRGEGAENEVSAERAGSDVREAIEEHGGPTSALVGTCGHEPAEFRRQDVAAAQRGRILIGVQLEQRLLQRRRCSKSSTPSPAAQLLRVAHNGPADAQFESDTARTETQHVCVHASKAAQKCNIEELPAKVRTAL